MANLFDHNTLFYGDNLPILREYIPSESIDLIYLDPPFNSNRSYNVLFKNESGTSSEAQITAFDDSWHWGDSAEETYHELVTQASPEISRMISALREFIGSNQMMAYLVMMAARLVELHRVLKPTGSLYLHCDPTASHYLKIVMDTIFGFDKFVNEIVWERSSTRSSISKCYRRAHDILLFYSKNENYYYNMQYKDLSEASKKMYENEDSQGKYQLVPLLVSGIRNGETGKIWRGIDPNKQGKAGMHWVTLPSKLDEYEKQGLIYWPEKEKGTPRLKYYLDQSPGVPLNDIWYDLQLISSSSKESLGYPTQKPVALLERILLASSKSGDLVLDPFCGCGTTIAAAQKLGRRWIGIDITHLSISLQKYRLKDAYNLDPVKDYQVIGEPVSLESARQLAQDDRYQFQWWALSLIKALPLGGESGSKQGKKGSDKGIDGLITFIDDPKGKPSTVVIQVKSGKVSAGHIRDLVGVMEREKAAIGVYLTLEPPSQPMLTEAVSAGYYESDLWQKKYPRLQILTVEELLDGKQIDMPPAHGTFKQAVKESKPGPYQGKLEL